MSSEASDAMMLTAGLAQVAAGIALLRDPVSALAFVLPATQNIEQFTGFAPLKVVGSEPALAMFGVLQAFLGFLYLMAVYTNDEKMKRNTIPGRCILAMGCCYVCLKTRHGSSAIALLGAFNGISGVAMGLTVGFGDGNAVDLEEAEKKLKKVKAAQAKSN